MQRGTDRRASPRQKFLAEEWPRIQATIQRLGLDAKELLNGSRSGASKSGDKEER